MNDPGAAAEHPEPNAAAAEPQVPTVSSYDAIPYSVGAFPQTRPDRLASVATLFGMRPADPSRCRVLELGCAAGGNLIPMALTAPDARFVGIDLSPRQISDAQATARELNLPNIDLRAVSILDIGEDFGQFDYILCHGVYSWVPPEVQEKILEVCSKNLSPQGVAYVSYNCYPGWHARGAIREMLWYHTARFSDSADRIREARGLLAFLVISVEREGGFGSLIRQELALLQATPDTYLLHEHLEDFNEPLYFHQFAGRAAAKGLQYLGEAQLSAMVASRFGPQTEKTLRAISPDLLHMEQYMDFLRNRMFRQTLLCHADVKLDYALRPDAVLGFRVASPTKPVSAQPDLRSDQPEQFKGAGQTALTTRDPLMKAAMLHLLEQWPLPLPFDEVLAAARARLGESGEPSEDDARQLALRLLNCYASNLAEFTISPPGFVIEVSDKPVASPYARLRARDGFKVNNLRLEAVTLTAPSRIVLTHLDGGHDRAALVELVTRWLKENTAPQPDAAVPDKPQEPPEVRARAYVDQLLPAFARNALLIA
jgi:methyltransferase-like protein/SAM-dependent methyltransferase